MSCKHCGQDSQGAEFCCRGCQAAYSLVHSLGLDIYYQYRDASAPVEEAASLALYRDPEVAQGLLFEGEYHCLLDGLHCAACAWLVERALGQMPGLQSVQVNYSTQRLRFQPESYEQLLPALERVQQLGYRAIPYDPNKNERPRARADRMLLMRFGVAASAAGNVMLAALALYSGADLDQAYRPLFQKLSFVLCLPVVFFSAVPFWTGARNALRQRRLTTDVSISLGLGVTFLYSLVATWLGRQHVYFDTVAMFVFVLLLGRLLEGAARSKAGLAVERLLSLQDHSAWCWNGDTYEEIPADRLKLGDRVQVRAGARVPADGRVLSGRCSADESHLTGESQPRWLQPGDSVYGGSLCLDGVLEVELTQLGGTSLLAQVARMVESAQCTPAPIQRAADRLAGVLLPLILLLSALTLVLTHDLDRSLAVLIITCPCALGIATPLVVSLAAGVAARHGVLFRDGLTIETARQVTHVVLDKTGTLTEGRLQLVDGPQDQRLLWAASLEAPCQHPLAAALRRACPEPLLQVEDWQLTAGQGVQGRIGDRFMRLGRAEFLGRPELAGDTTSVWLEVDGQISAQFGFQDQLRPEAADFVGYLQSQGLQVWLASGDRAAVAESVARELGIRHVRSQCLPLDKVELLEQLQSTGGVVAFLGDGINDAPALRKANLGICVANGSELSWEVADIVLLRPGLAPAVLALQLARRAWTHLTVNLGLALVYNAVAIPSAALGLITPLVAAVAMPLSSLVVVANSLLILNYKEKHGRALFSHPGRPGAVGVRAQSLHLGSAPRPV
ncbi:cadmium-translocating P-type ATPase [bacterium]|nr:cadmium-translocating P-type ATPase [bacterium]